MNKLSAKFIIGLKQPCLFLLLSAFVTLGGSQLAYAEEENFKDDQVYDPFEKINRRIFSFNNFVDKWFVKPVAKSYRWITPQFIDDGVSNIFSNLGEVKNILNAGLQGDFKHSGQSVGRLLTNSTLGVFGFFDVATGMGLEERKEDFGQTLAVWGVDAGPYIVLPFLGPSTMRDGFGLVPDYYTQPHIYLEDASARDIASVTRLVDVRADLIKLESLVSGDRYVFLRDIYMQRREADINNGEGESSFDSDFGDEDF